MARSERFILQMFYTLAKFYPTLFYLFIFIFSHKYGLGTIFKSLFLMLAAFSFILSPFVHLINLFIFASRGTKHNFL